MEGVWGYASWRWLFFIEGSLTILVAIWSIFVLPDFPESSHGWLTSQEKALAIQRMVEDTQSEPKARIGEKSALVMALQDGKVWWLAVAVASFVLSLSFSAYFPTLMSTLGYDTRTTLLLCVPPWVFATLVAIALSR
jgi:sugar phosphate permease